MMSTAEEVKAAMFGDDPSAGHHEVVMGPLFAKLERHPLPLARLDYTRVDDAGQITSQIAAPTPGARRRCSCPPLLPEASVCAGNRREVAQADGGGETDRQHGLGCREYQPRHPATNGSECS